MKPLVSLDYPCRMHEDPGFEQRSALDVVVFALVLVVLLWSDFSKLSQFEYVAFTGSIY